MRLCQLSLHELEPPLHLIMKISSMDSADPLIWILKKDRKLLTFL